MANTPHAKNTHWGMIFFLLVLIPVLLLGYKYASKKMDEKDQVAQNNTAQNNAVISAPTQNNSFPLAGDWYLSNNGTGPKYVNDKYSFAIPQMANGVIKGQLKSTMEWMETVKILNYEVISDGKLRITDPDNAQSPYEMEYTYNASSQTLEMSDQGYRLTYTRNVPENINAQKNSANRNNTSNSSKPNTGSIKTTVEKIAGILWKMTTTENGETFHYTRNFGKPREENGQIVGEYVRTLKQAGNYCTLKTNYKFTMISDSQYSWEIMSATCDGKSENADIGKTGFHNFELSNGGNTLLQWTEGTDRSTASVWSR